MSEQNCTHDCGSCGSDCSARTEPMKEPTHELSNIKKVIAVVSGKGGVGKSLVTSLMAVTMNRRGHKTAILDADVTGPSIPKVFGIHERAMGTEVGIMPCKSKTGIEVMSVNLLLEDVTAPVVWRGPIIAGTVKQFWSEVIWGDVDYMFVDMPPGTGDVPLTVFQSLPMADMMNIPILGLVENMSYLKCPDCNKEIQVFGESHVEEIAQKHGLNVLAKLPIDPSIAKNCDKGLVELVEGNWLDEAAKTIENLS